MGCELGRTAGQGPDSDSPGAVERLPAQHNCVIPFDPAAREISHFTACRFVRIHSFTPDVNNWSDYTDQSNHHRGDKEYSYTFK